MWVSEPTSEAETWWGGDVTERSPAVPGLPHRGLAWLGADLAALRSAWGPLRALLSPAVWGSGAVPRSLSSSFLQWFLAVRSLHCERTHQTRRVVVWGCCLRLIQWTPASRPPPSRQQRSEACPSVSGGCVSVLKCLRGWRRAGS